jgi:hypothetical protein
MAKGISSPSTLSPYRYLSLRPRPPPPQRRHSQDRPIHRPDDQASIQEVLHEALSNMDWIGGVSPLIVVMTNLAMAERGSLAMQVITEPPIHHSAR